MYLSWFGKVLLRMNGIGELDTESLDTGGTNAAGSSSASQTLPTFPSGEFVGYHQQEQQQQEGQQQQLHPYGSTQQNSGENNNYIHHMHRHHHHGNNNGGNGYSLPSSEEPPPSSGGFMNRPRNPSMYGVGHGDTLMASHEGTVVKIFDVNSLVDTQECKHIETVARVPDGFVFDVSTARCSVCSSKNEVWLCLVCHTQFCGRYENCHMLEHYRQTGHCVCMSLTDLSVWCNGCNNYLQYDFFPRLHKFFARMHALKFNQKPENIKGLADDQLEFLFGDEGEMHAVGGKCIHINDNTVSANYASFININTPCRTCETENTISPQPENWLCLQCLQVYCGRYNLKHMLSHYEGQKHPLCISLIDLSVWCYDCHAYADLSDHRLRRVYEHLQGLKFGNANV